MKKLRELYKQLMTGDKPDFALWAFPIIGLLILCLLPYLLTREKLSILDYTTTGQIGDTIGGIAGPVIALIAALLTFLAFWIQVQANKAQTSQFNKQDTDTKIDRFENKFYELLSLHKANVEEISIDGYDQRKIEKRKAFVFMYREFRFAFFVTKIKYDELQKSQELKTKYTDEDLLRLAYIFFYAGVGIHSDKLNKAMAGEQFEQLLFEKVNTKLQDIQKNIKDLRLPVNKQQKFPELEINGLGKSMLPDSYRPFVGHLNRFGHYYRHLFQTVKFVVNQDNKLIKEPQKLEYLRTLRAQLSDHEQVMLYYNAVVGFGKAWLDNKYFTDFKMIHNLPLPLADFGITPEEKFAKEIEDGYDLFEWL
ncbi:MAG: putative phage abortive infection protein [Bacteroidia bacterium]